MALVSVVFLLILLLLSVHVSAQQNQSPFIRLGASLSPNATSWFSPSGIFAFGFYPQGDGFAVGIWLVRQPENTIVWTAHRDDPPVSSNSEIEFTTDGTLILRTAQGAVKPIANASEYSEPVDSASMLDSGNFVLYGNDSVIWESFDFPSDTILGGQNLSENQKLVSSKSRSDHSSGRYLLSMQEDGNLVAYPVNSSGGPEDAYWASETFEYSVWLNLDTRGLLGLKNLSSTILILAKGSYPCEYKTIYRATLDADGIFRLYSHCFESNTNSTITLKWQILNNQCDVHGYCGFNSYCSGMGAEGDCFCYPGFLFLNSSERSLGCYKHINESKQHFPNIKSKIFGFNG